MTQADDNRRISLRQKDEGGGGESTEPKGCIRALPLRLLVNEAALITGA